jgi:hypothetical protein
VESAGCFDRDAELKIWLAGISYPIEKELKKVVGVQKTLARLIASWVLLTQPFEQSLGFQCGPVLSEGILATSLASRTWPQPYGFSLAARRGLFLRPSLFPFSHHDP